MIDEKLKNDISSIATNSQELLDRCISSLDEIDRANARAIADIEARANNLLKTTTNTLNLFVGANEEFKTIQSAIDYAEKYHCLGKASIVITLRSGFVLSESIALTNIKQSIYIKSEDEIVSTNYTADSTVFTLNNSRLTSMISVDNKSSNNITMFALTNNALLYASGYSFSNFAYVFNAKYFSNVIAQKNVYSNCGVVFHLDRSSSIDAPSSQIKEVKTCVATVNTDSFLNISSSTFTQTTANVTNSLLHCNSASSILMRDCNFTNASIVNKTQIATNTLTPSGIIYE